ncbi:MAG: YdeI/OmpD-associated family protein [Bacteroidota bacterium]
MPKFSFQQSIQQLEKRKGGYFYFVIDADIVNQFEKKRATRLICSIEDKVSYSCGLNHLGNGHFFIILATRYLKKLNKELGDTVRFEIYEDPNPLGVEIPEVLTVLLQQDEEAKAIFDRMTDGKKRSLIYAIRPIKDIDKQIQKCQDFLAAEAIKQSKKKK